MNTIKAALFDLDGTLFDTEGQYTTIWQMIGQQYHPEMPDFALRIKGNTLNRIMENYFPDPAIRDVVIAQLYENEEKMQYRFFAGAEDLLRDLRSHGVKVAVVTSSNKIKMEKVERKMPGFSSHFDHIFTAEDFSHSKPHPDCYLRAAAYFGLQPSECVVFEDALSGIHAGMSAGMFTIGMATTLPKEAIEPECSMVLDSFDGFKYQQLLTVITR